MFAHRRVGGRINWPQKSEGAFGALSQDQNLRKALLPATTPDIVKSLVEVVPNEVLKVLGLGVGYGPDVVKSAAADLKQDLEALCLLLSDSPYLVGDQPTLADLAVAGLSMLIKFPAGPYLDLPGTLRGKGVPGLADSVVYQPFSPGAIASMLNIVNR
jgi:glutathione S-transferase